VTTVLPGVWSDVSVASEWNVPVKVLHVSNGNVTAPPGTGPVVLTRNSCPLTGADAMFAPLVPERFSAPQFWPESGSPEPALPRPVPSPGNVRFGPY
jgi:hypothetical protein